MFSASFGDGEEGDPGAAEAPASASRGPTSPLAVAMANAMEKIRERAAVDAQRDHSRWPQISVYYMHDRLLCRAYYSIIPHAAGVGAPEASFGVADPCVANALAEGGVIFQRFAAVFEDHAPRLRDRSLQTLDLHLLTYAGVVAINEHLPNQDEHNLASFALREGEFLPVEAAEVRQRVAHERW